MATINRLQRFSCQRLVLSFLPPLSLSMQQKKGKRVSGEGLPGGKTVKVDDRRESATGKELC